MNPSFERPAVWLAISLICLAACTFLPLKIQNDRVRNFVMRWLLVPVAFIILLYAYPAGIAVFKKLALTF